MFVTCHKRYLMKCFIVDSKIITFTNLELYMIIYSIENICNYKLSCLFSTQYICADCQGLIQVKFTGINCLCKNLTGSSEIVFSAGNIKSMPWILHECCIINVYEQKNKKYMGQERLYYQCCSSSFLFH